MKISFLDLDGPIMDLDRDLICTECLPITVCLYGLAWAHDLKSAPFILQHQTCNHWLYLTPHQCFTQTVMQVSKEG